MKSAVEKLTIDVARMMARKSAVVKQNNDGILYLFKKNKVAYLRGEATLAKGGKQVTVRAADGKTETHDARKAVVIATGSRVKGLPQAGLALDKTTVLSSDDVLVLEKAPKTMLVVGAGAVGCEFTDVFAAYGTKVTLVDVAPQILPLEDADASAEVAKAFRKRGIDVLTGVKMSNVKVGPDSVSLTLEAGGDTRDLTVEKVLVAAGRAPNTDTAGLAEAGVRLTERGFVKVDDRFQTTVPGVYAIGDVAGNQMLAHKGSREGHVLAEVLAGQHPHPVNYANVPSCTYCHPEVASIGLTEAQVKEQKLEYTVGKFPFSANGRARTSGETDGFVKILRGAKYGEILGAHIVGAHATEMIHELVVARENEYTVEEIDLAIHAHPTLSEAVAEAALDSMGKMIHA